MSLVPEDVEADLEAQVTATHEVGHSEESGARYAGKTGGRSERVRVIYIMPYYLPTSGLTRPDFPL